MPHNGISRKCLGGSVFVPEGPPPLPSPRCRSDRDEASFGPASLLNLPTSSPIYTMFNSKTKAYREVPVLYESPRYPSGVRGVDVTREAQEQLALTLTRTMADAPPSPRQFPEPLQSLNATVVSSMGVTQQLNLTELRVAVSAAGCSSPSAAARSPREPETPSTQPLGSDGREVSPGLGEPPIPLSVVTDVVLTPQSTGKRHLVIKILKQPGDGLTIPPAAVSPPYAAGRNPSRQFRSTSFSNVQATDALSSTRSAGSRAASMASSVAEDIAAADATPS